jgi:hypothetical protein
MKAEGHLGRCYLKGHAGDAANVILTRRLPPPPRPRLAEDDFARRSPSDRRNAASPQTAFLTGDY